MFLGKKSDLSWGIGLFVLLYSNWPKEISGRIDSGYTPHYLGHEPLLFCCMSQGYHQWLDHVFILVAFVVGPLAVVPLTTTYYGYEDGMWLRDSPRSLDRKE